MEVTGGRTIRAGWRVCCVNNVGMGYLLHARVSFAKGYPQRPAALYDIEQVAQPVRCSHCCHSTRLRQKHTP